MPPTWKSRILELTEHPQARDAKIDATFFPPVLEEDLLGWEEKHEVPIPESVRTFLAESDGLEAGRGELWPVLPLAQWQVFHDECSSPEPAIRFGESESCLYLLSLGRTASVYRQRKGEAEEEFVAASFERYLEQVFRDELP